MPSLILLFIYLYNYYTIISPFRYQSCMEAKLSQPRTWEHSTARTVLSGYLTFENLSAPVGQREVRAYLDELEFVCPKFIY